ncbi:unnamed protein product [Parascedosporium putredinis]|uniref:Uncharacterized protein n=1 Tax=Parascedosporium putredinis TaxID=1442378 RepID=A0A9P1MCP0_9PEZI|nr:unnamed protein product [Parascedosporium putredinis]CAI7996971.1 unnamed protein product [Parascedosporium putredinis]
MSHDCYQKSQLDKRLLKVPARWTDEQLDFLRFLFPESSTPAPAPEGALKLQPRGYPEARLFSAPPPSSQPGEKLALLFQRRRLFFDCVVLPQLDSSGQEIRFLAYADEWHIILQKNLARKYHEHQSLRRDNYNPYIAALLIAIAQAHDDREAPYITRDDETQIKGELLTWPLRPTYVPTQAQDFRVFPRTPAYFVSDDTSDTDMDTDTDAADSQAKYEEWPL